MQSHMHLKQNRLNGPLSQLTTGTRISFVKIIIILNIIISLSYFDYISYGQGSKPQEVKAEAAGVQQDKAEEKDTVKPKSNRDPRGLQ